VTARRPGVEPAAAASGLPGAAIAALGPGLMAAVG